MAMADLVVPAGSPDKALAALALDVNGWSFDRAVSLGVDPLDAVMRLEHMAVAAKQVEPGGLVDGQRGPRTDKLINALRPLGAKIAPAMPQEQIDVWLAALVLALSDLPFAFSMRGAEDAIHVPMKFLNEVETAVREKAKDAEARHKLAVMRLQRMARELKSAGAPKLPEPKPLTQDDFNITPRPLLEIWLRNDIITQEQFDTAIAAQPKDEA